MSAPTLVSATATILLCLSIAGASPAVPAAYPKLKDCSEGEKLDSRDRRISWVQHIAPQDKKRIDFSLGENEVVVFRINTGLDDSPDPKRTVFCDLGEENEDDDDLIFQPPRDDENDGLVFQPIFDGFPQGCDLQDDDAMIFEDDGTDAGYDSSSPPLLLIDVKDDTTTAEADDDGGRRIISRKAISPSLGDEVYMIARGQKGKCAHPEVLEMTVVDGEGRVEVEAQFFRRANWNVATVDNFHEARNVLEEETWCGNINWMDRKLCPASDNAPKWTVSLQQNQTLLVTGHFEARSLRNRRKALRVMLRIYSDDNGNERMADILDKRVPKKKTFHGSFTNTGPSSIFYLELRNKKRHLYKYQMAFAVQDE